LNINIYDFKNDLTRFEKTDLIESKSENIIAFVI